MGSRKGIKEWLRKKVVGIKRNPQKIGLIAFAITFIYYSLNLTCISNTTAKTYNFQNLVGYSHFEFCSYGIIYNS